MLVLRLSRVGRKKYPLYRLVAADSRRPVSGKFVARLGHYNPHTKEAELDKEQIAKYLENGAQPSSAVVKLLKREKVKMPAWAAGNLVVKPEKKTEETEESAEAPAAKPEDESAEKPADEPEEVQEAEEATEEKPAEAEAESKE